MDERMRHVGPILSPIITGLRCRCPRCGKAPLFEGLLAVQPCCPVCGLDLAGHDSGDGPAVLAIMIVGFIVVGLALVVEVKYQPPFWLHALLWLPLTLGLGVLLLRPLKAWLVAEAYHRRRSEFTGGDGLSS
jgi:uncharacterized protein (DUF983 family)